MKDEKLLEYENHLPKHEGMKERFKRNVKMVQAMRNYLWEHFADTYQPKSHYVKYRKHGQFNGKKPKKKESIRKRRRIKLEYRNKLLKSYVSI